MAYRFSADLQKLLTRHTTIMPEFYIHGSVHRHSLLIKSNKMQQVFIYCKITLHVSGVYRTHHQEYIKL